MTHIDARVLGQNRVRLTDRVPLRRAGRARRARRPRAASSRSFPSPIVSEPAALTCGSIRTVPQPQRPPRRRRPPSMAPPPIRARRATARAPHSFQRSTCARARRAALRAPRTSATHEHAGAARPSTASVCPSPRPELTPKASLRSCACGSSPAAEGPADRRAEGRDDAADVGLRARDRLQPDRPRRRRDRDRPLRRLGRDGARGALARRRAAASSSSPTARPAARSTRTSTSWGSSATVLCQDVARALAAERRTYDLVLLRPAVRRLDATSRLAAAARAPPRARRRARRRDRGRERAGARRASPSRTSRKYGSARLTLFEP